MSERDTSLFRDLNAKNTAANNTTDVSDRFAEIGAPDYGGSSSADPPDGKTVPRNAFQDSGSDANRNNKQAKTLPPYVG
jgi:hypothetical protein